MLSPPHTARSASAMRLYDGRAQRLYINAAERTRFIAAAHHQAPDKRAFALTLLYTGCRLSEARSLTPASLQLEARSIAIRSLKKRTVHQVREVPIPEELVTALRVLPKIPGYPLWPVAGVPVSRITAYRWIKTIMQAATISGPQATPKGLRHGYGIHAIKCGVPLNMLQKWLGHASLSTTAIYTNALGADELAIAERMWLP